MNASEKDREFKKVENVTEEKLVSAEKKIDGKVREKERELIAGHQNKDKK